MDNKNNESVDFPDITSLLSSLVRLMSCYMREPSVSQVMTLVRLMDCLERHPDLPRNPAAAVAVKQARMIWDEELLKSRSRYLYHTAGDTPGSGLH